MVFQFDWRKIQRYAGRSSKRVLLILRMMAFNQTPRNRWDPIYPYYDKDFSGTSFLLNVHDLLGSWYKPKEIAEYVALASFRNYAYYAITKDATLDLLHSPVSEVIIKNNRLLSIENGRVLFKYEEVKRRNI